MLAILAIACATPTEAALLEIGEVGPGRLEVGRALVVRGDGFPPGREGVVRLVGTLHRPGRGPREVQLELPARAVARDRVEVSLTEERLAQLAGPGSLEGRVSVAFSTARGEGTVVGRSAPLWLDVAPIPGRSARSDRERGERALAWADHVGLSLGDREPDGSGLPIVAIEEGSVAARAGLVATDRLLRASGVNLYAMGDLVPPPGTPRVALEVAREGEAAPFSVELPVASIEASREADTNLFAQIALAWVLLVLLFLAPSAGLVDGVVRRLERRAPSPPSPVAARRSPRGIARLAVVVGVAASLPALDHAALLEVPLEAVLLGAFALRVSATWLGADPAGGSRGRLLEVAHALGAVTILAVGFGAILIVSGTTDLSMISSQQSLTPTAWTLMRTPLGAPVLALVVLGGGTGAAGLARGTSVASRVARGIDDLVLLVVAACATAVLLGGLRGEGLEPRYRVVAALCFVLATASIFVWMRRARRASRPRPAQVAATAVLALLVVLATGARLAWDPAPSLEIALAEVFAGAALAVAVAVAITWARKTARPHAAATHPFL